MPENGSFKVTTTDLKEDYDVIGHVYFQISNKSLFGKSPLQKIKPKYADQLKKMYGTAVKLK